MANGKPNLRLADNDEIPIEGLLGELDRQRDELKRVYERDLEKLDRRERHLLGLKE